MEIFIVLAKDFGVNHADIRTVAKDIEKAKVIIP